MYALRTSLKFELYERTRADEATKNHKYFAYYILVLLAVMSFWSLVRSDKNNHQRIFKFHTSDGHINAHLPLSYCSHI